MQSLLNASWVYSYHLGTLLFKGWIGLDWLVWSPAPKKQILWTSCTFSSLPGYSLAISDIDFFVFSRFQEKSTWSQQEVPRCVFMICSWLIQKFRPTWNFFLKSDIFSILLWGESSSGFISSSVITSALCFPPDPKHRRSEPEVRGHHGSSEAPGAGSGPKQGGIWEVQSGGGEVDVGIEGGWDGQAEQGEENCRAGEVRVKTTASYALIGRRLMGVLDEQRDCIHERTPSSSSVIFMEQ